MRDGIKHSAKINSELTDETTYPIPLVFFTVVYHRRQCQLHARDGATVNERDQPNQPAQRPFQQIREHRAVG